MDFSFTDDQLAFRDAVRDFLAAECPPDVVRSAWEPDAPGWPPALWTKLAEMGVVGLTAPEAAGGLGMGELDWVLLLQEAGRACVPAPLVEHTCVALPLLAAAGDDRLAAAAAGDLVVTVGFSSWPYVTYAGDADVVLLVDGSTVRVVDRSAVGERVKTVDRSRRLHGLDGDGGSVLLDDPVVAVDAHDRAVLGASAQLLGLSEHLIAVTVDYATQRKQFGAAIGTFQAVKHHLANAQLRLAHAEPVVHRAAWSMAERLDERSVHVAMAKAYAADAANDAARAALQVHGAIGYTFEYDLHLWMKRAWALAGWLGDAAFQRERIAEALGI